MRGGWANLGLVGLFGYLLGWRGRKSWDGLLELWSGATEYPNIMDYKWWSGVKLVEWSGCFESRSRVVHVQEG